MIALVVYILFEQNAFASPTAVFSPCARECKDHFALGRLRACAATSFLKTYYRWNLAVDVLQVLVHNGGVRVVPRTW